ncbi:hypothetical protein DFJ73DRAFT_799912 [Zopfochytrium polystomum]|nr:hypothetical protein DFJ73DRAFT_799912 [Zopfochytrium polystomum]
MQSLAAAAADHTTQATSSQSASSSSTAPTTDIDMTTSTAAAVAAAAAIAAILAVAPGTARADDPACTRGFQYPSFGDSNNEGFPGCPLPPPSWLPANCYGSNPNDDACAAAGYHLVGPQAVDQCKPTSGLFADVAGAERLGNQLAYLKSASEWCLILPNKEDPWLRMLYYDQGRVPQSVQAEGLVIAQCQGGFISSGGGLSGKAVPSGAILSASLTTNFETPGKRYVQMHGLFDPDVVGVLPADVDTGGQYDSSDYVSCGKEPYSGVDQSMNSASGPFASFAGSTPFKFTHYVQYFGKGEYCMRICEGLSYGTLSDSPCTAQYDKLGCGNWGINSFPDPGQFVTDVNGAVSSSSSAVTTKTKATTSSSSGKPTATGITTSSAAVATTSAATTSSKSGAVPAVGASTALVVASVFLAGGALAMIL